VTAQPPLPSISAVEQARDSARRQARALSGSLIMVLGIIAAVVIIAGFAALDYTFGQNPHRLIKLAIGMALIAGIVLRPRIGLFVVPLLTPFILKLPKLPIPGVNTLNVLLGSVFLSFATARIIQRRPLFRNGVVGNRLIVLLLMFGLWTIRGMAFPTGYEYDPGVAGIELFRTLMTFLVYFIVLSMTRGERERRTMTWAIVLGLLAESLVTIKLGRNFRGRASGTIDQPNDLGAFLAMFTPLAAALFFAVKRWWQKLVLMVSVVAGGVAVLLSVSRGGMLALAVALGYVAIRSSRALTVLVVVALITSPAWAPDYVKDRITGTQVADEGTDEVELENSSANRVDTWKTITNLVEEHPLDGVGFCGLHSVLSALGQDLAYEIKDSSHNTYLRMLGEMGILGLGFFLFILWTCWRLAAAGRKVATNAFDRQVALGYGAAVIALAISCMFGDRFSQVTIGGNLWALSAVVTDLVAEARGSRA